MAELNLIPELRFNEFETRWKRVPIGRIADIYDGTHQTPIYVSNGVPFVSVENIYDIENSKKFITKEAFNKEYKIKPKKGDILMTRITAGIIGATAIVKNNNPLAYYVSLALIRIKDKEVIVDYLNQHMSTDLFKRELHKRIIHIAFPKKINLGEINHCPISFPELPEQQKIASFLTAVDKRIQLLEEKKENLERYKKGAMQQIFSQEIRFKDEHGNDFPDWEEKKLGEVLTIGSGRDYKHLDDGNIPVYGTGGYMLSVNDYLFDGESVCIGRKGTIDKPMFLTGKFWTVDTLFYTHAYNGVIPFFIFLLFQQLNWKRYNEASGVPSLSKSTIEKISVMIPSDKEEQQKIATFLSAIDKAIEKVGKQVEETQQFKKGLLQKMFV